MVKAQWTTTNIAYAKRDENPQDYYADAIGTNFEVRGRVTSLHYVTNRSMFFIQDTNDNVGIHVYRAGVSSVSLYTEANVIGKLAQSNGLRMLISTFSGDIVVTDPVTNTVAAVPGTIGFFLADAERYEGAYVVISNVYLASGSWPAWNGTATLSVTDLTGQISMRIHSATDIDGQLAPTNAFVLYGIFSQFDTSATPNSGYQVWPRFYTDIIQSEGQEPPELFVVNSNTFSIAVGQPLSVQLIAQDRNPEDVLVVATNNAPAGSAVANLANREALFTWAPDAGYVGTTNKIILEVTDGVSTSTVGLDVFVLSDELSNIRLNEVHWDPAGSISGDANGDGSRNAITDEFVEIVNDNATDLDITGWILKYGASTFFTFPPTVLTGKTAVVVFGGGTPVGLFGHSIVYAVSPQWTGLGNNPGANAVSLWTDGGAQIFSYNYGSFDEPDMSATRNPDFTGDYTLHTSVVAVLRWSPGVMASGKYFEGTGQTNSAPIIPPLENRAVGVGKSILISFSAIDPESNPIIFSVSNAPATATFTDNGNGTATLAYTGLLAEAGTQFAISVYAGDGIDAASLKAFNLTVLSAQYDGLVLNEFLANPANAFDSNNDGVFDDSQDEFVEVVNNTTGAVDMAGVMIYDAVGLKHRFTSAIVPTGGAIVVFGGGSITNFAYLPAQKASSGGVGLARLPPESVILYSPQTNELDRYDYDGEQPGGASWTRYPDIAGNWTNHYVVTTNAVRASPGRRVHGQPFLTNQPPFFNPVANKSVALSNSLTFGVSALETDGDLVTLTASNLPAGAEFFPTNANGAAAGTFLWTNAEPAGVYTSEFYAVDEDGAAFTSVVITVSSIPVPGVYTGVVVVNEFRNGTPDIVELLVVSNGLNMQGMILKDFSSSGAGDNGGAFTFATNALWESVRSGTLIVLRNDTSEADVSVGGADYNLDLGLRNTNYFVIMSGTFDIAAEEMVQIKAVDSPRTGHAGALHTLATAGINATNYAAAPGPKLKASTGNSQAGESVYAKNSTSQFSDFDGTDAQGDDAVGSIGTWNTAGNQTYIESLRAGSSEPDTDSDGIPDWWEELYYGGPTNATPTDLASNAVNTVLEAFIADIDPLDPGAFFEIEDISGAALRSVTFLSSTGRLYTFQYSDNLINADGWSNLVTDAAGTNSTTTLSDTNPPAGNRSYRVRVRLP